jgi:hypothetical protein
VGVVVSEWGVEYALRQGWGDGGWKEWLSLGGAWSPEGAAVKTWDGESSAGVHIYVCTYMPSNYLKSMINGISYSTPYFSPNSRF